MDHQRNYHPGYCWDVTSNDCIRISVGLAMTDYPAIAQRLERGA